MRFLLVVCALVIALVTVCKAGNIIPIFTDQFESQFTSYGNGQLFINNQEDPYKGQYCIYAYNMQGDYTFRSSYGFGYNFTDNLVANFLEFYIRADQPLQLNISLGLNDGSHTSPSVALTQKYFLQIPSLPNNTWVLARMSLESLHGKTYYNQYNMYTSIFFTSTLPGQFSFYLDEMYLVQDATSSSPLGYIPAEEETPSSGTPFNTGGGSGNGNPPIMGSKHSNKGGAIAAGILVPLIVIAIAVVIVYFVMKRRNNPTQGTTKPQRLRSERDMSSSNGASTPTTVPPYASSAASSPPSPFVRYSDAPSPSPAALVRPPSQPVVTPTYPIPPAASTSSRQLSPASTSSTSTSSLSRTPPPTMIVPTSTPAAISRTFNKSSTSLGPTPPSPSLAPPALPPRDTPPSPSLTSVQAHATIAPPYIPPINHSSKVIFGVSIYQAVHGETRVPSVVLDTIRYLSSHALHEEGILRMAGSSAEVTRFRNAYDQGEQIDFSTASDINSVGDLLKKYLRELPEPLIPKSVLPYFDEACAFDDVDAKVTLLQQAMQSGSIGSPQRLTLRQLFTFLNLVTKNSSYNKMSSSNLAIVFSPTLKMPADVVDALTKNADRVFAV